MPNRIEKLINSLEVARRSEFCSLKQSKSFKTIINELKIINMKNRYFIYTGFPSESNLFGLKLNEGQIYSYDTILPETNQKLGQLIDFWIESGLEVVDFIEVDNINNSTGHIILALKSLCQKLGLEADVQIKIKE